MRTTIVCLALAAHGVAHAESRKLADKAVQLLRADPVVYTDGHGHYVAYARQRYDANEAVDTPMFYGDRTTLLYFGNARIESWGGVDHSAGYRGQTFHFREKDNTVVAACGTRNVSLSRVSQTDAKRLVASLKFADAPVFDRLPQRLARDDLGVYYYVDARSTDLGMSDFRLFIGKRGAASAEKLKDAVVDSSGELYITERGTLKVNVYRLLDREANGRQANCAVRSPEAWWVVKGRANPLTLVVPDADLTLIYQSLGAYTGEKFGTPCDIL